MPYADHVRSVCLLVSLFLTSYPLLLQFSPRLPYEERTRHWSDNATEVFFCLGIQRFKKSFTKSEPTPTTYQTQFCRYFTKSSGNFLWVPCCITCFIPDVGLHRSDQWSSMSKFTWGVDLQIRLVNIPNPFPSLRLIGSFRVIIHFLFSCILDIIPLCVGASPLASLLTSAVLGYALTLRKLLDL